MLAPGDSLQAIHTQSFKLYFNVVAEFLYFMLSSYMARMLSQSHHATEPCTSFQPERYLLRLQAESFILQSGFHFELQSMAVLFVIDNVHEV